MSKGVTRVDASGRSDVLLRFTVIRLAAVSLAEGDIAQNTDEAESVPLQRKRKKVVRRRCIKGLFARGLQVIENSGPNSRRFNRIKPCVLVGRSQRLLNSALLSARSGAFG
jgi:hypothetical protein